MFFPDIVISPLSLKDKERQNKKIQGDDKGKKVNVKDAHALLETESIVVACAYYLEKN
jgi:hypothetical protein